MPPSERKPFAVLFGIVVALILLGLYTYTTLFMIQVVRCEVNDNCQSLSTANITDGLIFINTTVAGLVAALVVSELAITQPGETPGARVLAEDASSNLKRGLNIVAALYIAVWMFVGLAALVVGVMLYEGVSETLTSAGTTWLGLAVAAGYSYFGIQPQS